MLLRQSHLIMNVSFYINVWQKISNCMIIEKKTTERISQEKKYNSVCKHILYWSSNLNMFWIQPYIYIRYELFNVKRLHIIYKEGRMITKWKAQTFHKIHSSLSRLCSLVQTINNHKTQQNTKIFISFRNLYASFHLNWAKKKFIT